jgi:hypothetical protein
MKPHNDRQTLNKARSEAAKPRFRIERLEERIAPSKGGVPGKPPYHYPPGQHCAYGTCYHCKHGSCEV